MVEFLSIFLIRYRPVIFMQMTFKKYGLKLALGIEMKVSEIEINAEANLGS